MRKAILIILACLLISTSEFSSTIEATEGSAAAESYAGQTDEQGYTQVAGLFGRIRDIFGRGGRQQEPRRPERPSERPAPSTGKPMGKPSGDKPGTEHKSASNRHFGGDMLWYGIQKERTTRKTLNTFSSQMKALGMDTVRFDLYWGLMEKKRGRYDWTLADDLVATVGDDVDILFTISSTNSWGSKYNECRDLVEKQMKRNVINEPPSSIPINMRDYTNFLEAMVKRYKSRVKYWQIENEIYGAKQRTPKCPPISRFWLGTPEEYLTLLKASYNTIKEVDPDAIVFASSYTFEPWDGSLKRFFRYVMDKGRNYSDLWDVHLYLGVDEDPAKIAAVKDEMRRLGYSKPLWTTESGEPDIDYHAYKRFKGNLNSSEAWRIQSEDMVKRYVQAFGEGVDRVFRLRIGPMGAKEGAGSRWTHMSLTTDRDGRQTKPAYYTYKLMHSKLAGFDSVTKITEGVYKFTVDGETIVVAWSDRGRKTIDLSSHFPDDDIKVTHVIKERGKTESSAKRENKQAGSVTIDKAPVFIQGR